jgi:copper resistance protein B
VTAGRLLATLALLACSLLAFADSGNYALTRVDRIEYRPSDEITLWELQGWYGGDLNKLWWKAEGDAGSAAADDTQFSLLYSRAIAAYLDLQVGAHVEDFDGGDQWSLALGLEGVLPYWIEFDATLYLSENGDVQVRSEFEREILLSQRLVLLPRAKLNLALQDIPARGLAKGINETALEFRLGYKVHHKLMPYIGLSWHKHFGEIGEALRSVGEDDASVSLMAGVRAWF